MPDNQMEGLHTVRYCHVHGLTFHTLHGSTWFCEECRDGKPSANERVKEDMDAAKINKTKA